ncbi:MAG: class I SAM-dependent methyltransferase [Terracidiphilus sp.]|jgi:O-methyltransferase
MLTPAIEAEYVDILFDPKFRSSVAQVKDFTCLDIARLANLWTLVRMAGPGVFLEIGSYKGGTALHICNAMEDPDALFYCFDPFETGGFERIGDCDQAFKPTDFMDTQYAAVVKLLSSKPRAKAVQGFFPAAAEDFDLRNIAFCHLDVDTYEATRNSLEYLAPRMAPRGLIVLDDVDHRETPGVRKAMTEFVAARPSFLAIPMFPVQAVLVSKTYWQS